MVSLSVSEVIAPKFPYALHPQVPRTSQEGQTYFIEHNVTYIQSLSNTIIMKQTAILIIILYFICTNLFHRGFIYFFI